MTIPTQAAVGSLAETASLRAFDARLESRLGDVQTLLGGELGYVEEELARAAARGARPGSDAARHLLERGGKRIRPVALLLSASCFGPIPRRASELAVVAELIHTATLLHDDVVDDGMERRGAPTSRRIWGNAVSVLGGDLLLVEALQRTEAQAPEALASLLGTLRSLVDGEIVQLAGRRRLDPSRDVYDRILRGKTASLFRWATQTGAAVAGASPDDQEQFGAFGELVGMAFQLVDDVIDYATDATEKTRLADLREGKLTLPLVIALERDGGLMPMVVEVHGGREGDLDAIRQRVIASGACDEVRRLADEYTARALSVLGNARSSEGRALLADVTVELSRRSR
jgi:octaprenyl-diphosphate synthase